MKRLILAMVVAASALVLGAQPAAAWTKVCWSGSWNFCIESTGRSRCFCFSSCSNPPPPCCNGSCWGGGGPAPFDALAAYGAGPALGYPPLAAAPTATLPAPSGSYVAPAPAPAPAPTLKPAAYSALSGYANPYAPSYASPGYAGMYGGFYQAPSYWYGN